MPVYIGYNTRNANEPNKLIPPGSDGGAGSITKPLYFTKKYRLVDEQLVIQDFINALNIPQGQKPGQPSYGTTLWSFIFEPNTADMQYQLEAEIRRIATADPRLIMNTIKAYPQDLGILLEIELAVSPFNNAQNLRIFFDQAASKAYSQ